MHRERRKPLLTVSIINVIAFFSVKWHPLIYFIYILCLREQRKMRRKKNQITIFVHSIPPPQFHRKQRQLEMNKSATLHFKNVRCHTHFYLFIFQVHSLSFYLFVSSLTFFLRRIWKSIMRLLFTFKIFWENTLHCFTLRHTFRCVLSLSHSRSLCPISYLHPFFRIMEK